MGFGSTVRVTYLLRGASTCGSCQRCLCRLGLTALVAPQPVAKDAETTRRGRGERRAVGAAAPHMPRWDPRHELTNEAHWAVLGMATVQIRGKGKGATGNMWIAALANPISDIAVPRALADAGFVPFSRLRGPKSPRVSSRPLCKRVVFIAALSRFARRSRVFDEITAQAIQNDNDDAAHGFASAQLRPRGL